MNKIIYFFIFTCIALVTDIYGETVSTIKIIDSLNSKNSEIVDKTIKDLGIEQGISGGFKKLQVLQPWLGKHTGIYILALSWDPPDGYVLLMDSSGNILSKIKTGYIKSISLCELQRRKSIDAVIIDSIVGYGSGYQEDKFQIFSFNKGILFRIWEGISYLSDIYMQNKEVDGSIDFQISSDDNPYDLVYNFRVKKYSYNSKTAEWSLEKTENYSKTYILKKDKYILRK